MKVKTLHLETVRMKTSNFPDCLLQSQNNVSIFQTLPQQGKNRRELFATSDHSSGTFLLLPHSDEKKIIFLSICIMQQKTPSPFIGNILVNMWPKYHSSLQIFQKSS